MPGVLSFSRTCHRFRRLSLDPILHAHRLSSASFRLSQSLTLRPSLSSLLPPTSSIYLSPINILARRICRQFVSIRLNRSLRHRPSASSLVKSNILPLECYKCDKTTGEVLWGQGLSPVILEKKRRIERERIKDGLRAWLERKAHSIREQTSSRSSEHTTERISVKWLVRTFTGPNRGGSERWGGKAVAGVQHPDEPTRAHVYGLRRFWESIAKG